MFDNLESPIDHLLPRNLELGVKIRELLDGEPEVQTHFQFPIGIVASEDDFRGASLKRSRAKNTIFQGSSFVEVAGTGCRWTNSIFEYCDFTRSNFDWSNFDGSRFIPKTISEVFHTNKFIGGSLVGASIRECELDRCFFRGTNLSQADFSLSTLDHIDIQSCTLEGATFYHTKLKSLYLNRINIEFCDFSGAEFDDVSLALFQFPYVFGITAQDFIEGRLKVSTSNPKFKNGVVPWEDLLGMTDQLTEFYQNNLDYFPIANLHLASGSKQGFQDNLAIGFRLAAHNGDYRNLKYLAKLADLSGQLTSVDKLELYQFVERSVQNAKDVDRAIRSFTNHAGEIRRSLLSTENVGKISVEAIVHINDIDAQRIIAGILNGLEEISSRLDVKFPITQFHIEKYNPFHFCLKFKRAEISYKSNSAPSKKGKSEDRALLILGVLFAGISAAADIKQQFPTLPKQEVIYIREVCDQVRSSFLNEMRTQSCRIVVDKEPFLLMSENGAITFYPQNKLKED
jgi:uncharacterized protein YjbI with pentapeptide repeats